MPHYTRIVPDKPVEDKAKLRAELEAATAEWIAKNGEPERLPADYAAPKNPTAQPAPKKPPFINLRGCKIREIREGLGLTQPEFAKRLNRSERQVNLWEHNHAECPHEIKVRILELSNRRRL